MKTWQWPLLALVWLLPNAACADAEPEPRWELELSTGPIWANGEDQLEYDSDRRIRDISSGERRTLRGRVHPGDHWYATGEWTQDLLAYESPLEHPCPLAAGQFLAPAIFCQAVVTPRSGEIEDHSDVWRFRLGYRHVLTRRLGGFVELGLGYQQWDSSQDIEARALASCVRDPRFPPVGQLSPNCTPIDVEASDHGLSAVAGFAFDLGARLEARLAWNFEGMRYRIYRNDVIARFVERNCEPNTGCSYQAERLSTDTTGRSSTWASAQLGYRFSEHLTWILDVQGGGDREWETASLGVRLSF
jgi:hypothetical protein